MKASLRAARRAIVGLVALAGGGLLLARCSNQGTPTSPAQPPAGTGAVGRVYWGALVKGETYGLSDPPWDMRALDAFESHARKRVSILHWGQLGHEPGAA